MHILELGHVVLYVTNIQIMAAFYRDILGFQQIHASGPLALFSGGRTHHELLLIEVGGSPKQHRTEPGLYHIGFRIGDGPAALREVYRHLRDLHVPIVGTADHTVTHSLYILDPDGNELELYADVSDIWKTDPKSILAPARPLDLEGD